MAANKSHYELLNVERSAPAGAIKRAYRREIALYHPDKVQHLGKEFQDLATERASQLTIAYQILIDERKRAEYDEQLRTGRDAPMSPPPSPPSPASSVFTAAAAAAAGGVSVEEPPVTWAPPEREQRRHSQHDDFIRRAAVGRFHDAVAAAVGTCDVVSVQGFDLGYISRPSRLSFRRVAPVRLLGRFVPYVDAAAVQETWPLASKSADANAQTCVFVMGTGLAGERELAAAIAEQRRRHRSNGQAVILIPVDIRDWDALIPTDAPQVCRSIVERLRSTA